METYSPSYLRGINRSSAGWDKSGKYSKTPSLNKETKK